jgi:hypothetical protein
MSYSFSVKAATKAEAVTLANEQFDAILLAQPVHAADMPAAREAVAAFTNVLMDDPTCDCGLSVNGSVHATPEGFRQVTININAGFNAPRE